MLPVTDLQIRGPRPGSDAKQEQLPTIILLHFYGSSRREWCEAGILLGKQFRVISIDTPGFGEAADVPGYSVAEMADSIAATIADLRPGPFMLVGHSMTGKVAAVLASRNLADLERLVLLTASPLSPEPIEPEARATMIAQSVPTRADAEHYVLENSNLPLLPAIFERAIEDRLRANPAAWRAWMEHGSNEDWSERVGSLSLPTLVIAAEKDKSLGPEVQRRLTMPHFLDVRLEIVAGCGHLVPMEAPDRLADLLAGFARR